MKEKKHGEALPECAVCGDEVDIIDCREIDGEFYCVECLRAMRLCELFEITGCEDEDSLYDFLGFRPYEAYEGGY